MQTFRRPELIVYLLTQHGKPYPKIDWSNSLKLSFKKGRTETIHFGVKKTQFMPRGAGYGTALFDNLQLNNFVNATKVGYLQEHTTNLFGSVKWVKRLCVLTNVGLLYFDDPLKPPRDLFPVLEAGVVQVN